MFSIDRLRAVTRKPGFIHTLAIMLANETLFSSRGDVKTRNRFDLLSFGEISLLLMLLSESPVDTHPNRIHELSEQYEECKLALDALHDQISEFSRADGIGSHFSQGKHFIEPIFYSASSAFGFDYLNLAPKLYQLDESFLVANGFHLRSFAELLKTMEQIFRRRFRDFIRSEGRKARRTGTFKSPLECFIFSPADFLETDVDAYLQFIEVFSVTPGQAPIVTNPLAYHPAKARPTLRMSEARIFAPSISMLCEQLFESPFYAIAGDKSYFARNANNRGVAAETILADLLRTVEGLDILKDAKLFRGDKIVDQIDVAAIFGATAILFEIKTKRLTEASKIGETAKLIEDVKLGILDAQRQLERSKSIILSRDYVSIATEYGNGDLLTNIREVICVSVMTHEIPSYPLLIGTILEKEKITGIIPVTIFDVKIIAHYLSNAFDFLYYFSVRSLLDQHLMYGTEQSLLAFHLKSRLSISENVHMLLTCP